MTRPVATATGKRGLSPRRRGPDLEAETVTCANVPAQSATSNDEWGYATRLMHDESCR